jgi:hypothetical protein
MRVMSAPLNALAVLSVLVAGKASTGVRPSSPVAQAIDGSAKVIVAAINQILHDQAGQG